MLARLLGKSVQAALGAGLFLTLVQAIEVLPLINTGEHLVVSNNQQTLSGSAHDHHAATADPSSSYLIRLLGTLLANLLSSWGFCLILLACMYGHNLYSRKPALQLTDGFTWGLCGFWIFFLAPVIHFPPQTPIGDLIEAQVIQGFHIDQLFWGVITLSSATGLAWVYYGKTALKRLGVLLVLAPHLILLIRETVEMQTKLRPADQAVVDSLESQFLFATTVSNLLYWIVLGVICTYLVKRPQPKAASDQRALADPGLD